MLAAYAASSDPDDPLTGLVIGPQPDPEPAPGWTTVTVRAAALNHHDLWSLRGVGLRADQLPMILGTDAAGVTDDGREVVVHAVIGGTGSGTPRSILSEHYPGTLAERVAVPTANLVDKPAELDFGQAACVPTAYLTAYRMLFRSGRAAPGQRVLVQGAGGGVAAAAIQLAAAAGCEVVATSRDQAKRDRALTLGAAQAVAPGTRIDRVDLVIETVGAATWSHSVRSTRPGGIIVTAGATTGDPAPMELSRIFFTEITVIGATMGTRDELAAALTFLARSGLRPTIDSTVPLAHARQGFAALISGNRFGKIIIEP